MSKDPRNFKVGQTVVCCDNFKAATLTKGKTYKITAYYKHSDCCEVVNDCGNSIYLKATRFRNTYRNFYIGQTVVCCNGFNVMTLTVNKTYKIVAYYKYNNTCEVINDCGRKVEFKATRFKAICEDSEGGKKKKEKEKKEKEIEKEMDIGSAYSTMQAASDIKVGDKVRVLRRAESREMGWVNLWTPSMDSSVGEVCEVERKNRGCSGIFLKTPVGRYSFPFFVLEVVESCRVITIAGKDIKLSEESYQELKKQLV